MGWVKGSDRNFEALVFEGLFPQIGKEVEKDGKNEKKITRSAGSVHLSPRIARPCRQRRGAGPRRIAAVDRGRHTLVPPEQPVFGII